MFVDLLVTVCLSLSNPGSCVTELVTNSQQSEMTMTGCMGVEGEVSAHKWVDEHPLYRTWKFKNWACKFGNKPSPDLHGT
jgi:hypothetical protein